MKQPFLLEIFHHLPYTSLGYVYHKRHRSSNWSIIYENGRQGAILNALISSNDCRVLFLMQELDKLHSGSPVHSSPDSALLTLMDGCGFVDNYWDIAIPTDQIFCIATCNDPDLISAPLRDRFIEIKGPAYTRDEKAVIFEQ